MFGFLRYRPNLPPISAFTLKSYSTDFSIDKLAIGVDNIRHDVHLSITIVKATRNIVAQFTSTLSGFRNKDLTSQKKRNWLKEIDAYKKLYLNLMRNTLNKAKGKQEVQLEYLVQAAMFKMLLKEIHDAYENLIARIKKSVRKSELSLNDEASGVTMLKAKLQTILHQKEDIQRQVGLEVAKIWSQIEKNEIIPMRESIFGKRSPFFMDLLVNPLLYMEQPDNEFFILAEYDVALGRRIEDPDRYEALLFFIQRLFNYIYLKANDSDTMDANEPLPVPKISDEEKHLPNEIADVQKIESWIQAPGNMDVLLDWQRGNADLQDMKTQKVNKKILEKKKTQIKDQEKILHFFYRQFQINGLLDRVVASYEMQPEYLEYCPPLTPHQVVQYLLFPKTRKIIKNRLRRLKKTYGRNFPLGPLNRKIKSLEKIATAKRKACLSRFIKAFVRYHRDRRNREIIWDAMDRINLITDKKIITLSRENNTLYEYLLSHEQISEITPIINHSVIKADVRGSTGITFEMNERGLNPASFFSLNFFDPISAILSEYDAAKVFIEGDAIILSIFERQNTPEDWYCIARSCGIALNMLMIIQEYNEQSVKNNLPVLELGIGISYINKAPAFLFDADNRIMISPAINQADRLSSCSKAVRKLMDGKKHLFNLYVFQILPDEELASSKDDLNVRFNVNGIELSANAFNKLSEEIDLKAFHIKTFEKPGHKSTLYTGKFPTKSGRYQHLVIREELIPFVDPETLHVRKLTSRKYYEVCNNPALYKIARKV
ncbi:MAG: hypothetical protein GY874_15690 [Desulfobacteraceae bacterium]|nr:hypothetical protein [Desulfobacteraceae bacterium]